MSGCGNLAPGYVAHVVGTGHALLQSLGKLNLAIDSLHLTQSDPLVQRQQRPCES